MAPKRSNKGKAILASDDKVEFKTPGMISIGKRVTLSRKIEAVVYPSADVDNFESLFKVSRKTFNHIRTIVRERMTTGYINFTFSDGKPMSLNDQIAISLTRLSSVDTSTNIAIMFETNDSTVDNVTWEFVLALEAPGSHRISWPLDIARTTRTKIRFESIRGMPNCCGAIETSHLKMYPDKSDQSERNVWRDRNNNYTMQLQVIVDPNMRFLDVVCGHPGMLTKVNVLQDSEFFKLVQEGKMLNGNEHGLPDRTKVPEYLVGDSGFPLLPWLITPYFDKQLTEDQTEFNRKHLATRLVAGCALKKLKEVWAGIEGGMWRPDRYKLPRIVYVCCVLHNIKIDMEGDMVSNGFMDSLDHDPGYAPEISTLPEDKNAAATRDKPCLYLEGKLRV